MPSAIIVEDEVLAAERLRVLLEECNVVLLNVFHHAMPALEWLSVHEVDIVFADIGMPEIDGLEFVERIKRTAKRQPEIVFTTAYEEHALRAFELAAADYLLKPIKMTRLQTALDRIIEKNREKADSFTHFKVYNREPRVPRRSRLESVPVVVMHPLLVRGSQSSRSYRRARRTLGVRTRDLIYERAAHPRPGAALHRPSEPIRRPAAARACPTTAAIPVPATHAPVTSSPDTGASCSSRRVVRSR